MFNNNNISCVDSVKDWEEAVRISSLALLESNSITDEYVTKTIENINKLGFYIVIDDYVAMPHSRPENGVNKTGISFLKINEGVYFGDNLVYLVFTLAAKNSNEHIEILQRLMDIIEDEELKEKLINCKDINILRSLLKF